jgi:hypothetical protein
VLNSHDGQAVTVVMIADWKACRETVANKDEDLGPGRGGRRRSGSPLQEWGGRTAGWPG